MPWKTETQMEQRQQLAILAKTGEFTVTELSRRFGVSRKTVHKWIDRFEREGLGGLADRHRAPRNSPQKTADEVEAIITADRLDRMLGYVERAEAGGAVLRRGGRRLRTDSGGWFMEPTIFDEVAPDAELACDEVFGPVLAVTRFDHADEAIALANATPYGLHASVFTSNVRTAHLAAARLRAGTVSVNTYSEGNAATPFGGYGLSGFGGRDNGLASHEQYTETKTVWLDLGAS